MKISKIKIIAPILLVAPLISTTILTSCNKTSLIDNLYQSAINEFYEWCKIPHPSGSLDEARIYLKNRAKKLGSNITVNQDTYGNIWFDVPAIKGYEEYPILTLQGHMDMVVDGLSEEEAKIIPIVPEITKDKDGREILHSKDYKTSLGADDGVALSTFFAILSNSSVKHGPIRVLLTADEEDGLQGACHLDPKALQNCNYLISMDGEGNKDFEYIICNGTVGCLEYKQSIPYTWTTTSLSNKFSIVTDGFKGGRSAVEPNYDKLQGIMASGNANRFLFEILYELLNQGKKIELGSITDIKEGAKPWSIHRLVSYSKMEFATDATQNEIQTVINTITESWKSKYKNENWESGVTCNIESSAITSCISQADSQKLIEYLGHAVPICPIEQEHWEGNSVEQKAKLNYPSMVNSLTNVSLKSNESFSCNLSALPSTQEWYDKLTKFNETQWKTTFTGSIVKVLEKDSVWNGDTKPKVIQLAKKAFDHFGIQTTIFKPRSALGECGWFFDKNNNLHQVQIGPRMDNCHTNKETLYLDTFKNLINVVLWMVENINNASIY